MRWGRKEDREDAQSSSFLNGKCEEINENLFEYIVECKRPEF